ncbi:MAG: M20/M25/M40 family metallo-hydrolase [Candidatus Magnetoovum sp. WYHC-5]|nr:M20/M25/M40 family metallo-hydrolase [Candidatus Magnetoovum sp. WYHC-5]
MININKGRLERTFHELLMINSPSFKEQEIAGFLVHKLQQYGLDVELQDYGKSINVIGKRAGAIKTAPPLLFCAHMDTVESTEGICPIVSDGIVKTSGTTILGADDKSGIAQILELFAILYYGGVEHGDLEVVFTSGEERFLVGAKGLDFTKINSRHAIIIDSNGKTGSIITGAPTHDEYIMSVRGKAAHAGIEPEKGISAIKAIAHIIIGIPDGRIDAGTTANIGRVAGGGATNIVPQEAMLHGEIRSHDAAKLDLLKNTIFTIAKDISKRQQVDLSIESTRQYNGFKLRESEPFVKILGKAFQLNGIEPSFILSGGGSDANIFNANGIKAINISAGYYKPHTSEESADIEEMCKNVIVLQNVVAKFSGLVAADFLVD